MDMARRRVDLRLDEDLPARLDAEAERLGQTRTKFVERALEKALMSTHDYTVAIAREAAFDKVEDSKVVSPGVRKTSLPPGVKTARELAMERQRKMNERKS